MRDNTERPITVDQGTNTLVGRDPAARWRASRRSSPGPASAAARPNCGTDTPPSGSPRDLADWLGCSGVRAGGRPRMNAHNAADGAIINALTIDVEDYFQVSAFAHHVPRASGTRCRAASKRNVDRILGMLADAGARATFFTLGWVAERYPVLVRRIVDRGTRTREPRLRARARERAGLRRVPGRHPARQGRAGGPDRDVVSGYRAPSFSVGPATSGRSTASPRPVTATARASIRSGTITTARPTRRALRTRCAPASSRFR